MRIEFKNVIPNPIKNELNHLGGLWGNDLDFNSNEYTLIDARSGKGKSTFTSIIAGLRFDYTGDVFFEGKNIKNLSSYEWSVLRRSSFSFIFQDLQLFDKLTVKQNLLLKNQLTDFKKESEIKLLIEQVGLENKWDQVCGTLSLGQQQRVSIIRALLQPAKFLVMDEPFSHLDDLNSSIALDLIKSHCDKNEIGIILTSLGDKYSIEWDKIVQIA
jgi:putative ABC transport system ATP-binding protein